MKRISTATAVANKFGAGKSGFTDGSVVGGVPATDLQADWFDHIQEELANLIEDQGIALDANSRVQLLGVLRGRLINVRVITSSGTYTPTVGTKAIRVTVQGAGGAGGGAAPTSAGQIGAGSGGNSGATAQSFLTSGFSGVAIIVGVGGTGSAGNGGSGGTTSFGNITAPGGSGGNYGIASTPPFLQPPVTNSGQASGGNLLNLSTGTGQPGFPISPSSSFSGTGASSLFGQGPTGRNVGGGGGIANNPGCGGAGALTGSGQGAQSGGQGANGMVIIEEFA